MGQKNGYFQVELKGKQGICHVFPPQKGGEKVRYQEIIEHLDSHGFSNYDIRQINQAISSEEQSSIQLGMCDGIEYNETMDMICSLDKMKITCRFFAGSLHGHRMDEKDIITYLSSKGIRYGIKQDTIIDFVQNPQYCTDYIIAEGTQPVHGKDAKIEYFFNTNINLQPQHNEDGSVDYHNLNMINHVNKGDLIAKLHPEDRGVPGQDVYGKAIPPRSVKSKKLDYGLNITISQDHTELYSDVTGHVKLINDKVFVSNVYEVSGDIDTSTGNVEYNGNVHVAGNVHGGFSIIAKGDVIVDGVVEDAMIYSEGQIIVKCGIHGMKRGLLEAKGNIITKFIENAKVFAGGYVESGAIIYSEVSAAHDVFVNEKKGFITGGIIRAGGKVEAQNIGSEMGAKTVIEVGIAPEKKERFMILQKDIKSLSANIERITPVIKTYQEALLAGKKIDAKNMTYLKQLMTKLEEDKKQLEENQQEYTALQEEMLYSNHSKVVVKRKIHSGVEITISDVTYTTKDTRSYCQFSKKDGEVVVSNL